MKQNAQMKSNYTTYGSAASAELELLAKREDNGKELRCEASNPALEGSLIETTTIKIECKCCHLPLTQSPVVVALSQLVLSRCRYRHVYHVFSFIFPRLNVRACT